MSALGLVRSAVSDACPVELEAFDQAAPDLSRRFFEGQRLFPGVEIDATPRTAPSASMLNATVFFSGTGAEIAASMAYVALLTAQDMPGDEVLAARENLRGITNLLTCLYPDEAALIELSEVLTSAEVEELHRSLAALECSGWFDKTEQLLAVAPDLPLQERQALVEGIYEDVGMDCEDPS